MPGGRPHMNGRSSGPVHTTLCYLLGVAPTATDDEVKKQYHKLAKEYHPDKNPQHEAKFKEITAAYKIFSDQKERRVYASDDDEEEEECTSADDCEDDDEGESTYKVSIVEITKQLTHEPWFHGPISREEAEARLHATGYFLVRQSKSYEGEIVLSAMGNGVLKHVFLIDEIGIIHTTHRRFMSIRELINFHLDSKHPLYGVVLTTPIRRRDKCTCTCVCVCNVAE